VTDSDCQETRTGLVFSDRYWISKLALAAGAFALLCHRAETEIGDFRPEIEAGALGTPLVQDKTVHAWARTVLAITADGFDIDTKVGPIHVVSAPPSPSPGDSVSVVGRISGPRQVVASAVQVEEGYLWKRGLNYGLSSLTVLAFLWIVRKRFRGRLSQGLFRARY